MPAVVATTVVVVVITIPVPLSISMTMASARWGLLLIVVASGYGGGAFNIDYWATEADGNADEVARSAGVGATVLVEMTR